MSIKHVPIKDCVENISTTNPLKFKSNEKFIYVDLSSINQTSKVIETKKVIESHTAPSRARQIIYDGDVLISTVRPNLNGVAKVNSEFNNTIASTGFCILRANKNIVDSDYLFNWVKTNNFINEMVKQATGASYPAVSDKMILNSLIPLPPLAEQKRIATILDKANEIKAKRELALAKLDKLAESVFQDIAKKCTQFMSLNQVADFKSGGTPSKDNKEFWDGDIAWISSADIINNEIVYGRNYISEAGLSGSATSLASKGTILVVTRTGIGKVAITDRDTCFSQDIVALSLKQGFETSFVASSIKANKDEFLRQARGATIQGITKAVLGNALVPKITLVEQRKFTQLSNAINLHRKKLISHANETSKFISSLQHQAFTTGFNA